VNALLVADVSIAQVIGGAERVLFEETTGLASRGHEVHILTRRLPYHPSSVERIQGVNEHRYHYNESPLSSFLKSVFSNCRRAFETLQKRRSFQILNFHQPFSAAGVLTSPSCRSIPKIYTCHSLSFEEYLSRRPVPQPTRKSFKKLLQVVSRKLVEYVVLKASNRVVVLSEYTHTKLRDTYNIPSEKIRVIPGGVDLERFKPADSKTRIRRWLQLPDDCTVLLTVRNLVPRMGLENLLAAFRTAANHRKDLLLVIGGEGPLAPKLKEMSASYGIHDSVRMVGFIPEADLPSYYQMADMFILPTTELEGFGLVTVEALASGLPVLGTPVGATREILVKLGQDFLFDDSTPGSIAAGILEALDGWARDHTVYKSVCLNCRRIAEQHYSWENHVTRLEALYAGLRAIY
jgi:glycosyltransferase involved in cell wall biosynthesis